MLNRRLPVPTKSTSEDQALLFMATQFTKASITIPHVPIRIEGHRVVSSTHISLEDQDHFQIEISQLSHILIREVPLAFMILWILLSWNW